VVSDICSRRRSRRCGPLYAGDLLSTVSVWYTRHTQISRRTCSRAVRQTSSARVTQLVGDDETDHSLARSVCGHKASVNNGRRSARGITDFTVLMAAESRRAVAKLGSVTYFTPMTSLRFLSSSFPDDFSSPSRYLTTQRQHSVATCPCTSHAAGAFEHCLQRDRCYYDNNFIWQITRIR